MKTQFLTIPLANVIVVLGNLAGEEVLHQVRTNRDSLENPHHPDYLGRRVVHTVTDEELTTQAQVDRACDYWFERLAHARYEEELVPA